MTIPWLRLSTRVAHFLGVTLHEETDFEVGVEAWGRGDYDRAVREFRLLAHLQSGWKTHAPQIMRVNLIIVRRE